MSSFAPPSKKSRVSESSSANGDFFPGIPNVNFGGPSCKDVMKFKHYNPSEMVHGKPMKVVYVVLTQRSLLCSKHLRPRNGSVSLFATGTLSVAVERILSDFQRRPVIGTMVPTGSTIFSIVSILRSRFLQSFVRERIIVSHSLDNALRRVRAAFAFFVKLGVVSVSPL